MFYINIYTQVGTLVAKYKFKHIQLTIPKGLLSTHTNTHTQRERQKQRQRRDQERHILNLFSLTINNPQNF